MFNLKQVWSNRLRAGATYCSACNSFYQGLGADVAKLAGWNIFKACYVDRSSPLFGARPVNFIHDQFLVEVREDGREFAAAEELGRLMNAAGALILPDVPVKCEPILARRWSKLAKGLKNEAGELVGAWEDMRLAS
jgi:DNA polymerase-1